MPRFLIDVNLPYYFSVWHGADYVHVSDLNDRWTDSELWAYAKEHDLTIVSKDADFGERVLVSDPPPRVIHVKLGNMRMNDFYRAISKTWGEVCELSQRYRLVRVFPGRIEGID